jgi:hypothetical protein
MRLSVRSSPVGGSGVVSGGLRKLIDERQGRVSVKVSVSQFVVVGRRFVVEVVRQRRLSQSE